MPRPATNAACYLGRWTVPSVTVVPSTPLNASVPIIINGNLTVPAGSAVQIVYTGNGTAPIVTVNGALSIDSVGVTVMHWQALQRSVAHSRSHSNRPRIAARSP